MRLFLISFNSSGVFIATVVSTVSLLITTCKLGSIITELMKLLLVEISCTKDSTKVVIPSIIIMIMLILSVIFQYYHNYHCYLEYLGGIK